MTTALSKKVISILALEQLSEIRRDEVLKRVGEVAIDGALNRLLPSLSKEKAAQLELYLDTHFEAPELLSYLLEKHPVFEVYLEEEILDMQEDILRIMA